MLLKWGYLTDCIIITFQSKDRTFNIALEKGVSSPSHPDSSTPLIKGVEKPSNKFSNHLSFKNFPHIVHNQHQTVSRWEWMVEIRRIMGKYSRNGRFYKLRHLSSRMMRRFHRHPHDDQQASTSEAPIINIFAPNNDDRFDAWGGWFVLPCIN